MSNYRIIGAYDTETTNICKLSDICAYPILYQLGIIHYYEQLDNITADNVEKKVKVSLFRHYEELYNALSHVIDDGISNNYVPVIMVHNLSFDMFSLAPFFKRYKCKVLAKTNTRPITITVCEDDKPVLVFWDTLIFYQKSLATLGDECGYSKALGDWDYSLIRTNDTELTEQELYYSRKDIYLLFVYLSYWLKLNPMISPEKLALNVVSKTGVVREKRKVLFDGLKSEHLKYNVGRFWYYQNKKELPKSNDELFTMHASTRGGFTFCAGASASIPYNLTNTNYTICGYDATSQHPGEMVSHLYPVNFRRASKKLLYLDLRIIRNISIEHVLKNWLKPFPIAFYGCFKFSNLRLKNNSLYMRFNIAPLAIARFQNINSPLYENKESADFLTHIASIGYKDAAKDAVYSFGKLTSASECVLFLTELSFFEVCLAYDFDFVEPISGYDTHNFIKPTDYSLLSVLYFYKAKNIFKAARSAFYSQEKINNVDELRSIAPDYLVNSILDGSADSDDIEAFYLGLKSDLNSLFGCEATNECRREQILTNDGIETVGNIDISNLPRNPKAWYQFGQRIVGWSRISQHVIMNLCEPYIHTIINGDTDSIKFILKKDNKAQIEKQLSIYAQNFDKAKNYILSRIKDNYSNYYDSLDGIGHYVLEFETDRMCASWNKAYCEQMEHNGNRHFNFTIAGIPSSNYERSINKLADWLYDNGYSYEDICNILLGYNISLDATVTRLNSRKFPQYGAFINRLVTDYRGVTSEVYEPAAIALYPQIKTINNTEFVANAINRELAYINNPDINTDSLLIRWSVNRNPEIIRL